jgi:hypothetical protein
MSIVLLVVAVLVAAGSVVVADPLENQVLKFQQRPLHGVVIGQEEYWGHNEWSTIYGSHEWDSYFYGPPRLELPFDGGVYMADDFADPSDTPVVHVRWWGSYKDNFMGPQEQGVQRFLISFEKDVPAGPDNLFSHPGEPILNQVVEWVPDDGDLLQRGSGTFHERYVPGGGNEVLFEYNAELKLPFWQEPDTVYWLKIAALVEPATPEGVVIDGDIVWGWHNRDYMQKNEYASGEVFPGEHIQGDLPDGTPIWHFQDNAVMGELDYVFGTHVPPSDEIGWYVWQNSVNPNNRWPQHYESELDGPRGIEEYSKDLAFELFTVPCVIPGDANLDGIVDNQDASILAAHWQQVGIMEEWRWGWGDFNDDGIVNDEDASILAAHWLESCVHPTPEPHAIVLLAGALLALPLLRRRKRT